MASFESAYTACMILVMVVAGLSSALFLVWRFRTQAPLLVHVAPQTKVQPWPQTISALGFYKTYHDENQDKYEQDGWCVTPPGHTSHMPKAEMKSTRSTTSALSTCRGLQISKMPKLLEHVQIFRPKVPPRIPSACPKLQLCSPKLNQHRLAPLAQLSPTNRPARSTLRVIVECKNPCQSPKRPRREMKKSEPSKPKLHPKCPQDTEEVPAWPQVASSETTRLLAELDGSQPIDSSPKQPIERKMENSCKVFFAKISLDGHGEPLEVVPQPVKTHRVPKRVIFIEPNIGSFPRHLEQIPALPQPIFLPRWPPNLRPRLRPTESPSELNTPTTPEPTPAPNRVNGTPPVKPPRPELPPLWPRAGPWWTFGRS
eukprot:s49_g69.t1